MSSTVNVLQPPVLAEVSEERSADCKLELVSGKSRWDSAIFAQEQIRGLVQKVFFPGWPRPSRQVVFSGIDQTAGVGDVCLRVAQYLAAQVPGHVCLIEANLRSPVLHALLEDCSSDGIAGSNHSERLRSGAKMTRGNLWFIPAESLVADKELMFAPASLGCRLGELRRQYEYAVIHAPPAGLYGEATLLGRLCDGVILVLQAHTTRRIAARNAKEMLQAANARLLGTVLNERTFPIPERLYRKL